MRIEREVVHPALFEATDRLNGRWSLGPTGGESDAKVFQEHQGIWWQAYGPGCLVQFGVTIALMIAAGATRVIFSSVISDMLISIVVLASAIFLFVAYFRNLRQLTAAELKNLIPSLELTAPQRVYAEALVAASEANLPRQQYLELTAQLNRLLDEEARLKALTLSDADEINIAAIESDRDRIAKRLELTGDAPTREALSRSLEICETRIVNARELSHVRGRVEAQLEMITQTLGGIRDSLRLMRATPGTSAQALDMGSVRATVDTAHAHSQALAKAVEEVRSLA